MYGCVRIYLTKHSKEDKKKMSENSCVYILTEKKNLIAMYFIKNKLGLEYAFVYLREKNKCLYVWMRMGLRIYRSSK